MYVSIRHGLIRNMTIIGKYMIHRFVSKAAKAREPKVELVKERRHQRTVIKYPAPDPRDRVDDEYNDDSKTE